MASKGYGAIALTGGGTGALDKINGSLLNDGDVAIVVDAVNNKTYKYTLEASSGAAESNPLVISPDTNAGTKRWILTSITAPTAHINNVQVLTASGDLVIKNQGAGTIATFANGQTLALANGGAINEFSIDGLMAGNSDTAVSSEKVIVTYINPVRLGYAQRSQFIWSDADQILIEPGVYHHDGTTDQLVYWNSQLDFKLQSGGDNSDSDDWGADGWHYIYLDDSAIDTLGSNLLDDTCFLNVTGANAAPAWTVAKHGWYGDGVGTAETNDRCIFACYETGNAILEFFHESNLVLFADRIATRAAATLTTTFADITALRIPAFSKEADALFYSYYVSTVGGNNGVWWRTNGQSGSTGHYVGALNDASAMAAVSARVITDSSGVIEMKEVLNTDYTYAVETNGWYFPVGM